MIKKALNLIKVTGVKGFMVLLQNKIKRLAFKQLYNTQEVEGLLEKLNKELIEKNIKNIVIYPISASEIDSHKSSIFLEEQQTTIIFVICGPQFFMKRSCSQESSLIYKIPMFAFMNSLDILDQLNFEKGYFFLDTPKLCYTDMIDGLRNKGFYFYYHISNNGEAEKLYSKCRSEIEESLVLQADIVCTNSEEQFQFFKQLRKDIVLFPNHTKTVGQTVGIYNLKEVVQLMNSQKNTTFFCELYR
ncbi:hypothetical protein [Paenibacillus sp. 2KB_22]|uniref:hypothetical protein n=1 Tax=Paenibacillus sp. 2KB_22 TaxID=3232978 RepID=UPI003F981807